VEASRGEVRLEAGEFDPHKSDQLAAPIEQKASAPWLRKRRMLSELEAKIYVVEPHARRERLATSEEIATGVYAERLGRLAIRFCNPTSAQRIERALQQVKQFYSPSKPLPF